MKPYESITEMINRLNALLTTLRKLGKHYSKEDVNTKILRVLPNNNWESRVTSIEKSHELSKLSTNILIGKLLTHELILRQKEEEQQEPSNLCFMALEDAFKVPLLSNSSCDYFCDDMCDGELDDDKELDDNSSLIRKLVLKCQKLLLKKKVYKQKFSKLSNNFEDFN